MTNHVSDSELAPSTSNVGNIDFRARVQCGAAHQVGVTSSLGGPQVNAVLARVSTARDTMTAPVVRRAYPKSLDRTSAYFVAEPTSPEPSALPDTALLQALLRLRHLRAELFPEKLFAQPAWDMLLELLECRLHRRRISVSSLYLAAHVPPATALRRIQEMEDIGLIARVCDPSDRRRQFVELTPRTLHQLQIFFRQSDFLQMPKMDERGMAG